MKDVSCKGNGRRPNPPAKPNNSLNLNAFAYNSSGKKYQRQTDKIPVRRDRTIAELIAEAEAENKARAAISTPVEMSTRVERSFFDWPTYYFSCPACAEKIRIVAIGHDDNPRTETLLNDCPCCSTPLAIPVPSDIWRSTFIRLDNSAGGRE